jgi:hypothetical protein
VVARAREAAASEAAEGGSVIAMARKAPNQGDDYHFTYRYGRRKIASQYAALEAEWYDRLKATGFNDIEVYGDPHNTYLREHHVEMKKVQVRGTLGGNAEYMRLGEELLDLEVWRTRNERWMFAAWVKAGWDCKELATRWPGERASASTLNANFSKRMRAAVALFAARIDEPDDP